MKNAITIDDAIARLFELRKQHGNLLLVMPTGSTEDDWDRYTIYSHVKSMEFVNKNETAYLRIEAGTQAYKN